MQETMEAVMQSTRAIDGVASARQSSTVEADDKILIRFIAEDDQDAMRVLFARHNVRVFRFLVRMVGDAGLAEDLMSETFIEVWRKAYQFEGRSQVLTWMLGIARNKALSSLRRRRHSLEVDGTMMELIEDPVDNPEVIMQRRDRGSILRDCLRQLSPAHREIIDLVYYHGRSIEEVSQIVGVPQNTVKTRMFHARKRIAKLMAGRGLELELL
jgi:RNA polymerase sigma-70 factor (ECF subfamily)